MTEPIPAGIETIVNMPTEVQQMQSLLPGVTQEDLDRFRSMGGTERTLLIRPAYQRYQENSPAPLPPREWMQSIERQLGSIQHDR